MLKPCKAIVTPKEPLCQCVTIKCQLSQLNSLQVSKLTAMVGAGSSCGACKFLRRKCEETCVFAPYFNYDKAEIHFAAVHKVFGASNVSKLLSHLPIYGRAAAAITISYEAQARIRDPVRGCISHILALQQQVYIIRYYSSYKDIFFSYGM